MVRLKCSGWWEQQGYGRQSMSDLLLSFSDGKIVGTGFDIVGAFQFDGYLKQDRIYLLKSYIESHQIEYHGVSIGEGAYSGEWSSDGYVGGKWLLGVERQVDAAADTTKEVREV